jgi:hypothetical protein
VQLMGSGACLAAGHTSVSGRSLGTLLPGIVCVKVIWLPVPSRGHCSVTAGGRGPPVRGRVACTAAVRLCSAARRVVGSANYPVFYRAQARWVANSVDVHAILRAHRLEAPSLPGPGRARRVCCLSMCARSRQCRGCASMCA